MGERLQIMEDYLAALDAELRDIFATTDHAYATYYGMFRYHLGWTDQNFNEINADPGKRVRPLICLVACQALGGVWHNALPVAASIELVHNFSLIHDDIEDDSDTRRGRLAVWKVWGIAQGLNAGDGMFVLSRLALGRMPQRGLSVEKWAAVSSAFDAATLALCQGQYLDLSFESRFDVSPEEYLQMIRGKTAALISASARFGAMLATDNAALVASLAHFGEAIGLAFQITDDILGIWGDPSITGKSAATDIKTKKKSLPVIIGFNDARCGAELRRLYAKSSLTESDIHDVLRRLEEARARERAQKIADEYRVAAIAALEETKIQNPSMQYLREIADVMTNRVR